MKLVASDLLDFNQAFKLLSYIQYSVLFISVLNLVKLIMKKDGKIYDLILNIWLLFEVIMFVLVSVVIADTPLDFTDQLASDFITIITIMLVLVDIVITCYYMLKNKSRMF